MLAMLIGWSYAYFAHLCCDFQYNLTSVIMLQKVQLNIATKQPT